MDEAQLRLALAIISGRITELTYRDALALGVSQKDSLDEIREAAEIIVFNAFRYPHGKLERS